MNLADIPCYSLFISSYVLFLCPGNASEHVLEPQPETKAMMELILERGYTLSVALNGGDLVVTYPYDRPVQPGNASLLQLSHTCFKSNFADHNRMYL